MPSYFDQEYHGPNPPGDGWTQEGTGPRGGKIWTKETDDSPAEPEPEHQAPEAPETPETPRDARGFYDQMKRLGATGTQAKQVTQYARQQVDAENAGVETWNECLKHAVDQISQYEGKRLTRRNRAFNGGDYASIKGFDQAAESMAHLYPALFPGKDGKDHQETLWSMLQSGPKAKMTIGEAIGNAYDEFLKSDPKLRKQKGEFTPVEGSPLGEERQRQIHDVTPPAAAKGNTARAHQAVEIIDRLTKGGADAGAGDRNEMARVIEGLNRNELWVLKKALNIGNEWDKGSRRNQVNLLLDKAGLGDHAHKPDEEHVPFSEDDPDDAWPEWSDGPRTDRDRLVDVLLAWQAIDGTPEELNDLLRVEFATRHTSHAEPAAGDGGNKGEGKVAPTGGDDRAAMESLLHSGMTVGVSRLCTALERGIRTFGLDRALRTGILFDEQGRARVQADVASALATGDLLGRARVRLRAEQVQPTHSRFSEVPTNLSRFADTLTAKPTLIGFPEELPLLTPLEAYGYFTKLVPELNVNPDRFGEEMERRAFTCVVATEKTLVQELQDIIADAISHGTPGGAQTIRGLLVEAGVAPQNPQYAEMFYRTNIQDASAVGFDREMSDPDVADLFPAWLYSAITGDGRGRLWHVKKNNRLYPSARKFTEVRGTEARDVCNCRCCGIPIDKYELAGRLSAGEGLHRD